MSSKKKELLSTTMKRTTEWIFSQEIPSDITVRVGSCSFSLHKFPLVSKCGYIRKLVSASTKANPLDAPIADVPGGAEAFELVVNFCYGVNFEISIDNIAMLRCVAEYLEMTEECAVGNLIGRAEAYLSQVALRNLSGSISVLHSSEKLLPLAEDVKLVSRCIDAIAYLACKDTQSCVMAEAPPIVDWWAEDLAILKIDFFHRVLVAMMALGFKQCSLGPFLMLYAQKSLRGLDVFGKVKKRIEPREEHEKTSVLETIVSLLPKEKNALSVSFLAMLLRFSKYLETTVACRVDLEKRIALQLGQAVLGDLLIPCYSSSGGTLFDVDTVRRIVLNYLEYVVKANSMGIGGEEHVSPPPSDLDLESMGRIMEKYLAEIASDRGLTVAKFVGIAQLIPEQTRAIEDGMYRAIDVFLKAHPEASEMERKQVCSLMDCQKLSREACAHAAQNDRIPVQTVVQVLYYEQQRIRSALDSSNGPTTSKEKALSVEGLRRENEDLRVELVKTKMRLKEFESPVAALPLSTPASTAPFSAADHNNQRLPRKSFISSVSKKLGRLYPLIKVDAVNPPPILKARSKPGRRDRRHSIS